jgi:hypothetical protein
MAKHAAALRAYEQDYAGWAEDTAMAIEEGRFDEIDRTALADEIRDLSKSERARIESALRVLLIHLLKAKYQPAKHTKSWDHTINIQRLHVARYLRDSPSLRAQLDQLLSDAYETVRFDAENETGLMLDTFPETCEWTVAEVLGRE